MLYILTGVFSKRSNGFKNSIEAIVRITVVIMDRIIENCTDFWKLSCSLNMSDHSHVYNIIKLLKQIADKNGILISTYDFILNIGGQPVTIIS